MKKKRPGMGYLKNCRNYWYRSYMCGSESNFNTIMAITNTTYIGTIHLQSALMYITTTTDQEIVLGTCIYHHCCLKNVSRFGWICTDQNCVISLCKSFVYKDDPLFKNEIWDLACYRNVFIFFPFSGKLLNIYSSRLLRKMSIRYLALDLNSQPLTCESWRFLTFKQLFRLIVGHLYIMSLHTTG